MSTRRATVAQHETAAIPHDLIQLVADRLANSLFIYEMLPDELEQAAQQIIPLIDDYPRRDQKARVQPKNTQRSSVRTRRPAQ